MSSFDNLFNRMETLTEMADSFKQTVRGAAGGEDGLNMMLKAYRNERTGKPVGAVSRVKNLIVLRALYDKDYINDEQFQALAKKATSSNYISNTLKEINPVAHNKLFGSKQESGEIINHIKLNAKNMLNFGLTNLQGKKYVEAPVEDTPEDPDAMELEDEVTDEVVALAKGLTSKDLEGTILDFDDVDVTLQGLDNQDEITRNLISVLNGAGYTAEATPAGFNVEAPIGSFGTEEDVKDLMTGLILKYFPGVSESGIGVLLNTTVEDAESFNEKPDLEGEIDPSRDPRTAGEALNDARDDRDGEDTARERLNATNPAEDAEVSVKAEVLAACKQRAVELAGPEAVTTNAGMAVGCESMYNEYGNDGDQVKAEIAFNQHHYFDEQAKGGFERTPYKVEDAEVSVKAEVLAACKERAGEFSHKAAGMAQACEEMYNVYGKDGDQERAEIALSLHNYFKTQTKFEDAEEELTLESIYDVMGFQEIKAPLIDENGKTSQECTTQQYLTEAVEQEIEKAGLYTEGYLTEQKTTDSYIKSKPEPGQTFKERYKPKTSYQLEELRRYGL